MSNRYSLTVELVRSGENLHRKLHAPHQTSMDLPPQRFSDIGAGYEVGTHRGLEALDRVLHEGDATDLATHLAGTALQKAGEALFEALFGPDASKWEPFFATLFQAKPPPALMRYAVRVRVVTKESKLVAMPWSLAAVDGVFLRDSGWTFEVARDLAHREEIDLVLPTGVLLILPELLNPDDPIQSKEHGDALIHLLDDHFPGASGTGQIAVASTREAVINALRDTRPSIVYYYGHGTVGDDGQPSLSVFAEQHRTGDSQSHWNAHDVVRAFRDSGAPVRVVFLNGWMTGRGELQSIAWRLLDIAPVVLAQPTTAWTLSAREVALRWLRRFLTLNEDPVVAATTRAPSEPTTGYGWMPILAFARFASFNVRYARPPDWRTVSASDLDRHRQRKDAFAELQELVRHRARRVQAFLVYGPQGNHHHDVAMQLHKYIEKLDSRFELVMPKPHPVAGEAFAPRSTVPDADERRDLIEAWMKVSLDCDPSLPLADVLRAKAPPLNPVRRRILWLDWGVLDKPDVVDDVEAWLAFCSGPLAKACPTNLRIVASLCLDVTDDRLDDVREGLDDHVNDATFRSDLFRCNVLPPLGPADLGEIIEFLIDSGCPQNICDELARWMKESTRGHYAALITLIERGLAAGWVHLYNELREKRGQRPKRKY